MHKRPLLMLLAMLFAVQTAAAAMCIGMPAAHAAELTTTHCHSMTSESMVMPSDRDMAPHACIHCDAPDLGTPDMPAPMAMPAMGLLAVVVLPQAASAATDSTAHIDTHAQAPPDPLPLYLTTQRIRI
jgi:hypothetical protein